MGLIGMNFRGLVSKNRLKTALFEARRSKHQIVFAQEHNIRAEQKEEFERAAKDMGFTAIIGECEEHRGGAALFLKVGKSAVYTP